MQSQKSPPKQTYDQHEEEGYEEDEFEETEEKEKTRYQKLQYQRDEKQYQRGEERPYQRNDKLESRSHSKEERYPRDERQQYQRGEERPYQRNDKKREARSYQREERNYQQEDRHYKRGEERPYSRESYNKEYLQQREEKQEFSRVQLQENISERPKFNFIEITSSPSDHILQNTWVLSFFTSRGKETSYDKLIEPIAKFSSVEGFWKIYNHLLRPNDFSQVGDYHLFKYPIKPLWEDEANKVGGKWTVKLKKGLASKCWEDLLFALIGEQFDVENEICGAVVSIRYQEDSISVWNVTSDNNEAKITIQEKLKQIFPEIVHSTMEYKKHYNEQSSTKETRPNYRSNESYNASNYQYSKQPNSGSERWNSNDSRK